MISTPSTAQQVNTFGVCTQNQEIYQPGRYDRYGNYVPGGVTVQTYNVPCNQIYQSPSPRLSGINCNPTSTFLGALLGGGIAASMSRGNGYAWSVPVGAAVGGAIFGCN